MQSVIDEAQKPGPGKFGSLGSDAGGCGLGCVDFPGKSVTPDREARRFDMVRCGRIVLLRELSASTIRFRQPHWPRRGRSVPKRRRDACEVYRDGQDTSLSELRFSPTPVLTLAVRGTARPIAWRRR